MKKTALTLFILSGIGVLLSGFTGTAWLYNICKPMIMTSLLFYYLVASDAANRSRALMLAIMLSLAGDVLLMNDEYFIAGLVSFLMAHILYIFAYRQHQHEESGSSLLGLQRVRLAFPIILSGTGLVVVLYPVLGELRVPVIIYATVLVLMAINALFRQGRTSTGSFWMVFGGAVLFMISDTILAINKFLEPLEHAGFFVMSTYIPAQYFIVKGLLNHPHR